MKVKFKRIDDYIKLKGFVLYNDMVYMRGDGINPELIMENPCGFILYKDDEKTVIRDCSDYLYRWDIYNKEENQITLTNSETNQQRKPKENVEPSVEEVGPLSNEELTECVAELLYKDSLRELEML